MKKNTGKSFELDFKKSIPDDVYIYRLRDPSSSFAPSETTRFSIPNACDFIAFYGGVMHLIELKHTNGKSLPVKNIKPYQLAEMSKAAKHPGLNPIFVIHFSGTANTYAVCVLDIVNYINRGERASIPESYCKEKGITIESKKLRVTRRYNLTALFHKEAPKNESKT